VPNINIAACFLLRFLDLGSAGFHNSNYTWRVRSRPIIIGLLLRVSKRESEVDFVETFSHCGTVKTSAEIIRLGLLFYIRVLLTHKLNKLSSFMRLQTSVDVIDLTNVAYNADVIVRSSGTVQEPNPNTTSLPVTNNDQPSTMTTPPSLMISDYVIADITTSASGSSSVSPTTFTGNSTTVACHIWVIISTNVVNRKDVFTCSYDAERDLVAIAKFFC